MQSSLWQRVGASWHKRWLKTVSQLQDQDRSRRSRWLRAHQHWWLWNRRFASHQCYWIPNSGLFSYNSGPAFKTQIFLDENANYNGVRLYLLREGLLEKWRAFQPKRPQGSLLWRCCVAHRLNETFQYFVKLEKENETTNPWRVELLILKRLSGANFSFSMQQSKHPKLKSRSSTRQKTVGEPFPFWKVPSDRLSVAISSDTN